MNKKRTMVAVLMTLVLAGCATPPPRAEIHAVGNAFAKLDAASQTMFDDLAKAEREQGRHNAIVRAAAHRDSTPLDPALDRCPAVSLSAALPAQTQAIQTGFCLEDSYYYSALTDPPATLRFRKALAALNSYTTLILALADDYPDRQVNAQLQDFAGNAQTALSLAGTSFPLLKEALVALSPLISLAEKNANRTELKRLIQDEFPTVERLALALRNSVPELFNTLTERAMARYAVARFSDSTLANTEAQRIEGYRTAASDYVVLLDQYRFLLRDVNLVYRNGDAGMSVASLTERSAELAAAANAWRSSWSGLRAISNH